MNHYLNNAGDNKEKNKAEKTKLKSDIDALSESIQSFESAKASKMGALKKLQKQQLKVTDLKRLRNIAKNIKSLAQEVQNLGKQIEYVRKTKSEGEIKKTDIELLPADLNKIPNWLLLLLKNQCPSELQDYGMQPAKLSEIYAYRLFSNLLALDCKPWGSITTLFEEFSDGFFLLPNKNVACLYDTKAYKKCYNASKEILKSANYVKKHKRDMFAIIRSEIKYFVIISSEFCGDPNKQKGEFFKRSCAKLVLCRAEDLSFFTVELRKISEKIVFLQVVDWEEMFSKADPFLTKEIFKQELGRLRDLSNQF